MDSAEIKVRGYHLDLYGHVNNARYLEFLEEGRWAAFEGQFDLREWQERGLSFFVVNINISYRKPATLGELLEVRTNLSHIGNKSGVIRQEIVLKGTDTVVTDADVTFVIADARTGKALPLEGALRSEFESLLAD